MTQTLQRTARSAITDWLDSFRVRWSPAMSAPPPTCSPKTATGATSSRSPGTSSPSRAGAASRDLLDDEAGHASGPAGLPLPTTSASPPRSAASPTLDRVRDRRRAGRRAPSAEGRQGVDAAHHDERAQGPRGADAGARGRRAPSTEQTRTADLAGTPQGRSRASSGTPTQPYVVIVGGGQGGIALGARLRQLGVPTIIVDRNPRPGDAWRKRYKSLCLHDPVWYDHLPYIDVPRQLAGFLAEGQDRRLAGDVREGDGAELLGHAPNARTRPTTRTPVNGPSSSSGTARRSRCGRSNWCWRPACPASPTCPSFPGMDIFKGDQHHSSKHPGPDAYRGKRAVVIGSNNSAHDICAALWEGGADVTMVQRSSTHIVKSESLMDDRARRRCTPRRRWPPA